ncbi:MAG: HD domain-containing protein [Clostridia bacterium]|nr:HD domain-containing protein [Clostridia bacterium]
MPDDILEILSLMKSNGISAYVVGGAVRDILMGRMPDDYDMAAECLPDDLIRAFSDRKTVDTGIRFGTLSVFTGKRYVEITCCRSEGGYSDLRRPDSVAYCKSIEKDLARRDFTVNAIAMTADGKLIDPYGGQADISCKIIRAVGDPSVRFREDALRIIRALRFASTLGFAIDDRTCDAIHDCSELLRSVSGERVFVELKKLLLGNAVLPVLMDYSDVITVIIPELSECIGFSQNNPHHIYTVYEHIARSVAAAPKDVYIRLCMLLHDIAKPASYTVDEKGIGHFYGHPEVSMKMAKDILRRLKADTETVNHVCFLIKYHDTRPAATRKSLLKYLTKVGFGYGLELIDVRRADLSAQSPAYFDQFEYLEESSRLIKELQEEKACIKVSDLAVNGNDLIKLGIPAGRKVGETLSYLLSKVVSEKVTNDRDSLLALAKKNINRFTDK